MSSYAESFGFPQNFDITKPLWNQNNFYGRLKHFMLITNTRNVFNSKQYLLKCNSIVENFILKTLPTSYTKEEILNAKKLKEASFHPDSGEYQHPLGRMCSNTAIGAVLSGGMLAFYKSNLQVMTMQWINQSSMAFFNYTNRNARVPLSNKQVLFAYVTATTSAMGAAVVFRMFLKKTFTNPILLRFVPYFAVAVANCINIPLMRQNELINGVKCSNEFGEDVCVSKLAAMKGISQTVIGRALIPFPSLICAPILMQRLEQINRLSGILNNRAVSILMNTIITFSILHFSVPAGCAMFPQRCTLKLSHLRYIDQPEYLRLLSERGSDYIGNTVLTFNKGL